MASQLQKDFDNIKVSTTTIIAHTGLVINMDLLFDLLPVQELNVPENIRCKKKLKPILLNKTMHPELLLR